MNRVLFILVMFLSSTPSFACEQYAVPEKFKQYFNKLNLSYEQPVGKIAYKSDSDDDDDDGHRARMRATNKSTDSNLFKREPKCHISVDLTGNGQMDFAGLYKYSGPKKRSNHWDLDLVILYSSGNTIKHIIYPYSGQIVAKDASVKEYLVMHNPGVVDLMPGRLSLDRPGIVAFRNGRPAVTYYWNGKGFSQQPMGVDD